MNKKKLLTISTIFLILSVIIHILLGIILLDYIELSDDYCQLSNKLKELSNSQTEVILEFGERLNYDLSDFPTEELEYTDCPLTNYKEVN